MEDIFCKLFHTQCTLPAPKNATPLAYADIYNTFKKIFDILPPQRSGHSTIK